MTQSTSHPLEKALSLGLRRLLVVGALLSIAALVFGAPDGGGELLAYNTVHLIVLQVATFAYAIEIAPLSDRPWFPGRRRPWLASVASLVALVVGYSALLTLASSAAARYDPSLQFLQLLSSLDIAWVVSGLYFAVRSWGRKGVALAAGSGLLLACVASIFIYLSEVGFATDGGWLVDGAALMRIVIPSDVMAAILTTGFLIVASKRQANQRAGPLSHV